MYSPWYLSLSTTYLGSIPSTSEWDKIGENNMLFFFPGLKFSWFFKVVVFFTKKTH